MQLFPLLWLDERKRKDIILFFFWFFACELLYCVIDCLQAS